MSARWRGGAAAGAALLAGLALASPPARAQARAPRSAAADRAGADRAGALSDALEAVAARVGPSVVQVVVGGRSGVGVPGGASGAVGSGFVLDVADAPRSALVVTNAHVVQGAVRLAVLVAGSGEAAGPRLRRLAAEVVGRDDETDIALLRVTAERGGALPPLAPLPFTRGPARAGQLVLAVGSPFGLKNSVALGVVSAAERQLDPDRPAVFVQTDAPIHPGSSGGPLVDMAGEVVGLSTFVVTRAAGGDGLGFAVPAAVVQRVAGQLRRDGRVRRGDLGVVAQTITPTLGQGLQLARDWGVILADVLPGSPADRTGVRIADRVLAVDGTPVTEAWQLEAALDVRAVGDTVRLALLRADQAGPGGRLAGATDTPGDVTRVDTVAVVVAERAGAPDWLARVRDPVRSAVPELGIVALGVSDADPELAPLLEGRRLTRGVLVAARLDGPGAGRPAPGGAWGGDAGADDPGVGPWAPAWATPVPRGGRGFQTGDLIRWINGRAVASVEELRAAMVGVTPGEPIVAHVDRGGTLRFVAFERP